MNKKAISITIKVSDDELNKINEFIKLYADQFDRSEFIRICTNNSGDILSPRTLKQMEE